MNNQAELLLYKVLKTCRAKSNVGVDNWHSLQVEIKDHLEGKDLDLDKIKVIEKVYVDTSAKKEIIGQKAFYKLKAESMVKEINHLNLKVKRFEQMEKGIMSIINQRNKQ